MKNYSRCLSKLKWTHPENPFGLFGLIWAKHLIKQTTDIRHGNFSSVESKMQICLLLSLFKLVFMSCFHVHINVNLFCNVILKETVPQVICSIKRYYVALARGYCITNPNLV